MKKRITVIIFMFCLLFSSPIVFAQDLGQIAKANFSAAKGESLYVAGRYDEAVSPLEDAINIRPEHGRAHYNLALTYAKLGQEDKAISLLDSYLNHISHTNEWLGSMDKEYIAKCKELLSKLKVKTETAQSPKEKDSSMKADTIVLKSGKTVEGKIIERTDKYIKIDFQGVLLTYFNDDIRSIREQKPSAGSSLKSEEDSGSGEKHIQKDGLFSISIPKGWHWKEKPGDIMITNPEEKAGIAIEFAQTSVVSEEQAKEVLKKGNEAMIKTGIEPVKGSVLGEKEIRLDGMYSRQLDFCPTLETPKEHITYISCLNKGYVFTITFGSDKEEERLLMEKAVETFKFL